MAYSRDSISKQIPHYGDQKVIDGRLFTPPGPKTHTKDGWNWPTLITAGAGAAIAIAAVGTEIVGRRSISVKESKINNNNEIIKKGGGYIWDSKEARQARKENEALKKEKEEIEKRLPSYLPSYYLGRK